MFLLRTFSPFVSVSQPILTICTLGKLYQYLTASLGAKTGLIVNRNYNLRPPDTDATDTPNVPRHPG